jgi:hypothetical protein
MNPIDLNGLYEKFLRETVKNNPDKYSGIDALENDIGMLTDRWENEKNASLSGKSPKEFVNELATQHELFDYVEDCLEANIEIADVVCFEVLQQEGAEEFLKGLLTDKSDDAKMLGAVLLREKGGSRVVDIFLEVIINPNYWEEIKEIAYDYLSEDCPEVVDKILNIINTVSEEVQAELVELLANYKGNKAIFFWLVTMLYRSKDVPLFAKLLGAYEDVAAVDILKSYAADNADLDYVEYVEIRNAVERLGGEFQYDKDFSDDELFKYVHGVSEDVEEEDHEN